MGDTSGKLLRAATALLDLGGPSVVTLREVGRRAGVSHNTPYKHFASKEHLLAAVAAMELNETARLLTEPAGGLVESLRAVAERWQRYPQRFRLVYGPWSVDADDLAGAAADAWTALCQTVEAAMAAGEIPHGDVPRTANLLRALLHGAVELELGGHLGKSDGDLDPAGLLDEFLARIRD